MRTLSFVYLGLKFYFFSRLGVVGGGVSEWLEKGKFKLTQLSTKLKLKLKVSQISLLRLVG